MPCRAGRNFVFRNSENGIRNAKTLGIPPGPDAMLLRLVNFLCSFNEMDLIFIQSSKLLCMRKLAFHHLSRMLTIDLLISLDAFASNWMCRLSLLAVVFLLPLAVTCARQFTQNYEQSVRIYEQSNDVEHSQLFPV